MSTHDERGDQMYEPPRGPTNFEFFAGMALGIAIAAVVILILAGVIG
jgi:hypothetical protein